MHGRLGLTGSSRGGQSQPLGGGCRPRPYCEDSGEPQHGLSRAEAGDSCWHHRLLPVCDSDSCRDVVSVGSCSHQPPCPARSVWPWVPRAHFGRGPLSPECEGAAWGGLGGSVLPQRPVDRGLQETVPGWAGGDVCPSGCPGHREPPTPVLRSLVPSWPVPAPETISPQASG